MNTLIKTLLISVSVAAGFQHTFISEDACRRIQQPERLITPAPGINPDNLFFNTWVLLEILNSQPGVLGYEILGRVYPELSSVAFSSLATSRLTEQDYADIVAKISAAAGIDPSIFPDYASYFSAYGREYARNTFSIFEQDFTHKVNTSGNMQEMFKTFWSLYLAEYIVGQTKHLVNCKDDAELRRNEAHDFYAWMLRGGEGNRPWNQRIVKENRVFILDNSREITAYSLVSLFLTAKRSIDQAEADLDILRDRPRLDRNAQEDFEAAERRLNNFRLEKQSYVDFVRGLYGTENLSLPMQGVMQIIEAMVIDESIKQEILGYFR